uniref:mRNA (guanine-N(7))-methyltransferase n=1 Tax=Phytophthora ramorum TaxID=164328 RepID=H3GGB4_PHYRM
MEVSEEPLPPEWEVAMSRSKNMPYYYNAQTKKVYWVDDELPRGWSHQFDRDGRRFYFHVRDKNATISYDKPVLRDASPSPPLPVNDVASPEPLPVPAPSYDDSPRGGHAHSELGEPPQLVRKKSNSLMDLLSPGPPALVAEEQTQGGDRERNKTEVQFIQGDLGMVDLLRDEMHCWSEHDGWHDAVPLSSSATGNFNIVSVQFSFHYMFGDAQRANRFFSTVHELLADGGVLIATTVDPNKLLMKYYQGLRPLEKEREDQEANKPDVSIVDEKEREVCCIRFDAATRAQLSGPDAASEGVFGLRYNFTLRDRVEDAEGGGGQAVDLPEYLVPDDLLAKLLREHGFELLLKQNFHRFIQQRKDQDRNRTLLEKMHVTNIRGSISDAEWEIAGLYQVLAFKKSY